MNTIPRARHVGATLALSASLALAGAIAAPVALAEPADEFAAESTIQLDAADAIPTAQPAETIATQAPVYQAVAQVKHSGNVQSFASLDEAISYAASLENTEWIQLLDDVDLDHVIKISAGTDALIDANGHTLSWGEDAGFHVLGRLMLSNFGEGGLIGTDEAITVEGSNARLDFFRVNVEATSRVVSLVDGGTFSLHDGSEVSAEADGSKFPEGYQAVAGEGSVKISGGRLSVVGHSMPSLTAVRVTGSFEMSAGAVSAHGDGDVVMGVWGVSVWGDSASIVGGEIYATGDDLVAGSTASGFSIKCRDLTVEDGLIYGDDTAVQIDPYEEAADAEMNAELAGGTMLTSSSSTRPVIYFFPPEKTDGSTPAGSVHALITGGTYKGGNAAIGGHLVRDGNRYLVEIEGGRFFSVYSISGNDDPTFKSNVFVVRGGCFYGTDREDITIDGFLDENDDKIGYREVDIEESDEEYVEGYVGFRVEPYERSSEVKPSPNPETGLEDPANNSDSNTTESADSKRHAPKTGDYAGLLATCLAELSALAAAGTALAGRTLSKRKRS